MGLLRCSDDVVINPDHVSSIEWDRGHSYTAMVVTMQDGRSIRLRHEPHLMNGTDCYLIEAKLVDATRG